ncbi:universal stress protein [Streptomyces lavendulocolor]|uniref:universal stress protein n=1 Tax=Streptomyces lavendulocolor TaxID=67316 RepID=UPI0031D2B7BA
MTHGTTGSEIVVGVDPDPAEPSEPALDWAAEEAARRNLPLRLLVSIPPLHDTQHVDTVPHYLSLKSQAERALASAAGTVVRRRPALPVTTELFDGMPARVICRTAARRARLIVLGSRRLTRPEEIVSARSVVVPVSAQADCPVVVVREPAHPTAESALVVGVDGSESSRSAVAFAVEEASLRHAGVHALWAWRRPAVSLRDEAAGTAERRRLLAETVAGWAEEYPDVRITQDVVRGHPVEELARASADALAVVAGRRGRGGYSGMRLGSVVHGLLHRATCPVITVPA